MHLGALAAHVFHHAPEVGRARGAGLEFVVFVAGAAMVHELVGIAARSAQRVQGSGRQRPRGHGHQRAQHPFRMGGAPRDIDHGQAAARTEVRPQQATCAVVLVLQATGLGRVAAAGGDATPGRTTAHGNDVAGQGCKPAHPVDHRQARARQHMETPCALRPAQQRTLDAQRVEPHAALQDVVKQREQFGPTGK